MNQNQLLERITSDPNNLVGKNPPFAAHEHLSNPSQSC